MKTWEQLRAEHLPACIYCGDPADTRDHVPPRSWGGASKQYPACIDCNCRVLRDVPLFTIEDRRAFVQAERARRSAVRNMARGLPGASPRRAGLDPSHHTGSDDARRDTRSSGQSAPVATPTDTPSVGPRGISDGQSARGWSRHPL